MLEAASPGSVLFSSVDDTVLPIEVHVFNKNDTWYAFDARNYGVLTLEAVGAAVLSRMRDRTVDQIVDDLDGIAAAPVVRAHYLRFLQMIQDGAISVEPLPRTAEPRFNRLVLMLAGGCNMGCSYCFERDVPVYQKPNLMTREGADGVLEWYFAHQEGPTAHVQLYGGEPLLNWPILTYVVERMEAWAAETGKTLTKYLITNGTLLDPARIQYLRDHDVSVQVSVDGDKKTHDRFRTMKGGQGTMDRIRPNIERLNEADVDFNLRAVLTRQNRDPEAVVGGLRSLGAERVSFEVVATDEPLAQFDRNDWAEFLEHHQAHLDQQFESWSALPADVQSMIIKLCEGQHVHFGCGAGKSEVTVAPDGSIYECQRIYRSPYANVKEGKGPKELASTFLTQVDDRDVCRSCWARYLCGGGCLHQSHMGHGTDAPLPEFCTMERQIVEAAIVKIHELQRRAASGAPLSLGTGRVRESARATK